MPQPRKSLGICATLALFIALLPALGRAGTWVAFQNSYTRSTGAPVTVTNTFTLLNPATQYTLKAFNGGLQNSSTELVSSSFVLLNGVQIIGPSDFSQNVAEVNVMIFPGLTNALSVQVRGQPGGVLTVQVIGVDNDPPSITATPSAQPNAAGWYNSPVTVNFACSDKTSGVAACPSPITLSTEGANQVVSGTATDLAGNTAPASYTVNLDMTPPTITATINPPPDAAGYNSGPVTVTFTCADTLSGVGSCPAPVSVTTEGTGQVINGIGTDRAGNLAQVSITVNISLKYFFINSYEKPWTGTRVGKCLDYGGAPSGAIVFLNDCQSSPSQTIRVEEVTPPRTSDAIDPTTGSPIVLNHEVLLFAGNQVIGVGSPTVASCVSCPPSTTTTPPTEYSLELQPPWYSLAGRTSTSPANQIWRLDGDSIILEGTHTDSTGAVIPGPCINTVASTALCPPPPPQLVIQVQNARGANGSPLVVAPRNLADNEFWDFQAAAGPGIYPTSGFVSVVGSPGPSGSAPTPITTNWQLWNAICGFPQLRPRDDYPIIYDPGQPDDNQVLPVAMVCQSYQIPQNLQNPQYPRGPLGWGSVIVVAGDDPFECYTAPPGVGPCIDLSFYPPILLPAGVTLRGNRRGTSFGPQIYANYTTEKTFGFCEWCMLELQNDYIRITGLRLRGPTDPSLNPDNETAAIQVDPAQPLSSAASSTQFIVSVDHNDISYWGETGVGGTYAPAYSLNSQGDICGARFGGTLYTQTCSNSFLDPSAVSGFTYVNDDPATLANVQVARNFVHDNHRSSDTGGYGVGAARALVDGNTFLMNRHAITSDGEPHTEYRASHNLVLSRTPAYGCPFCYHNQDFDMHGTENGYGGVAGYYVDIAANTFLGTDRANYWLRGGPILNTDFHGNVSLQSQDNLNGNGNAVQVRACPPLTISCGFTAFPINIFGDQFKAPDPTAQLGVGDFDGDGTDDLFLATGNTWFYSPWGAREWRFLSAKAETIDRLLFGDFDGDGRTDVVTMHGGQLVVSWGGVSDWEPLPNSPSPPANCTIADMAVGDFNGDGKPDIFCADGMQWWIWYGGTGSTSFVQGASYGLRRSALLFGDFDHDGTTDVFAVVDGGWYYSKGATGAWADGLLQTTALPTTNGNALTIGDFNGDGIPDVATLCTTSSGPGWQISYGGTQPWSGCNSFGSSTSLVNGPVGHFSGGRGADILFWSGNGIWSFPGGTGPAQPLSSQDMR